MSGTSINALWKRCLAHILRFGIEKTSQHGRYRECVCLVSMLDGDDDDNPCTQNVFHNQKNIIKIPINTHTQQEIDTYIAEWKMDDVPEPKHGTYTYPHRIKKHFGYNQLHMAVDKLKRDAGARYAVISLWDHTIDNTSKLAPCLTEIQLILNDNKLILRASFRSHDMGDAYALNLNALRYMQKDVCAKEGWGVGNLVCVSTSAHIYAYYYEKAAQHVKQCTACTWDKRGNVSVSINENNLVVTLRSPGGEYLTEYTGKDPTTILDEMILANVLSQPGNWTWLALELASIYSKLSK